MTFPPNPRRRRLGVEVADELRHLRPVRVTGLLHDRRHLGVGGEVLPAVHVPVEDGPDPVLLVRVAEDGRALRAVQLALLGALRRVDLHEPVEILHCRRCQDHLVLLSSFASPRREWKTSLRPARHGAHRANDLWAYELWMRSCSKAQTVAAARLRTPTFR